MFAKLLLEIPVQFYVILANTVFVTNFLLQVCKLLIYSLNLLIVNMLAFGREQF